MRAPYSAASRLAPQAFDEVRTSAGVRHVRVPTVAELGRITAVIVSLVALFALVAVAPQAVLIPLGVALVAGLIASALIALVGWYPRMSTAPRTVRDASHRGATPHSR
jgi:hypothetical protein